MVYTESKISSGLLIFLSYFFIKKQINIILSIYPNSKIALLVAHLEGGQEGFLRQLHVAHALHAFFAFLLFFQ